MVLQFGLVARYVNEKQLDKAKGLAKARRVPFGVLKFSDPTIEDASESVSRNYIVTNDKENLFPQGDYAALKQLYTDGKKLRFVAPDSFNEIFIKFRDACSNWPTVQQNSQSMTQLNIRLWDYKDTDSRLDIIEKSSVDYSLPE